MQIAICDDESFFRKELHSLLVEYKSNRRLNLDIFEFSSGEDLLKTDLIFDIIFLDYQMSGLNGMEVARSFRQRNYLCSIVFVTNYPDFVFDSFEVNPYRFFRKPISTYQIEELLKSYITQQKTLSPIIINDYYGQYTIKARDIIYLEGDGKYCLIRTKTEVFHSSKTLSGVLNLLPKYCFYRVHKSYAVNLYCIQKVINNEIILVNGEKVLISRNNLADFKIIYKNFIKDYYLNI